MSLGRLGMFFYSFGVAAADLSTTVLATRKEATTTVLLCTNDCSVLLAPTPSVAVADENLARGTLQNHACRMHTVLYNGLTLKVRSVQTFLVPLQYDVPYRAL